MENCTHIYGYVGIYRKYWDSFLWWKVKTWRINQKQINAFKVRRDGDVENPRGGVRNTIPGKGDY